LILRCRGSNEFFKEISIKFSLQSSKKCFLSNITEKLSFLLFNNQF